MIRDSIEFEFDHEGNDFVEAFIIEVTYEVDPGSKEKVNADPDYCSPPDPAYCESSSCRVIGYAKMSTDGVLLRDFDNADQECLATYFNHLLKTEVHLKSDIEEACVAHAIKGDI